MDFSAVLHELARFEETIQVRARDCREKELEGEGIEKGMVKKVAPLHPTGLIAGVDGGCVGEEFHGCDVVFTRAVGVIFEYEKGKRQRCAYVPASFPPLMMSIEKGLDTREVLWHRALARCIAEIRCACDVVIQYKPAYLLLDGSLVPHVADRPPSSSPLFSYYEQLVTAYQELFTQCERANTHPVGVIKDSRSRRFCELVEETIRIHDTVFLDYLLNVGERTVCFPYSEKGEDELPHTSLVRCFYLKASPYDRPVRIEYVKGSVETIASILYALCAIHQHYAAPAVLIEADMRAAITPEECEHLMRTVQGRGGKISLSLRRNERPFR